MPEISINSNSEELTSPTHSPVVPPTANQSTFDEIVNCYHCQKEFDAGDLTFVRIASLETRPGVEIVGMCKECLAEKYWFCDGCKTYFRNDDSSYFKKIDDECLCENCFNEKYTYCEDCNEPVLNDHISFVCGGDRQVCNSCLEEYSSCCECGYTDTTDSMCWCDECDNYYCQECRCRCGNLAGGRQRNRLIEREVLTIPRIGIVSDKILYSRLVGLELEAENGDELKASLHLPPSFGISYDGSLNSTGIEIQTPPASWEELARNIELSTKILKKHGFRISKRCGMHIHLDASDFKRSYTKIAKILKTYYAIENLIYQIVPKSRREGTYCLPLQSSFDYPDFNIKKMADLERNWYQKANNSRWFYKSTQEEWDRQGKSIIQNMKKGKYCDSRYLGVNIHSIFFRGTLELRHHSGTLNKTKIFHWINFNLSLVDYATKRFKESEIQKLIRMIPRKEKFLAASKIFGWKDNLTKYLVLRAKKFNHGELMEEND